MALSRGRKILYGCLILMGAAVIFVIAVFVLFFRWLQTPTEPLEALRLVDSDTRIYIELTLQETNPGARDMVRALFSAQQNIQRNQANLPPFLTWVNTANKQTLSDEDIDELLPLATVISRQAGTDDESGGASFVIDLPSAGNGLKLFDRIFAFTARRTNEMGYTEYLGEQYYRLPLDEMEADLWMSVVGTHLALAMSEAPIRSVVERIARTPEQRDGRSADLMPLLSAHPPASVVRLASVDATEPLIELVDSPFPELATLLERLVGDSRVVTGWLELESPDTLVGELQADTGLTAAETPGRSLIGDVIRLEMQGGRMAVTLEPIRADNVGWSAWRMRLDGVVEAFQDGLEDAQSRSRD